MVAALCRAAAALGAVVRFVTPLQYNRYAQGDHFEQVRVRVRIRVRVRVRVKVRVRVRVS